MIPSFLLMFFSLYLAQMGDKTQLLTLLLATRTKKHFLLFLAIMAAFTASIGLAVIFGAGLSLFIPHRLMHAISGSIFIFFGILLFRYGKQKHQKYEKIRLTHPFLTAMLLTFLADFGDKTQIALALFATANHPLLVFGAGILALGLDTFLMIIFSKLIIRKINQPLIEKLAGILFILVGIYLLIG